MSNRLTLATVFLVAMLIGANFSILKFALEHTTPFLMAGMRTVVGGSALLAFALLRGEKIPRRADDLARIFVVSFSITTVSSGLLLYGVNRVPAGLASLISSTMPLFTAVLTFLLLQTRIPRKGIIGLIVGFVGTLVLASPSLSGSSQTIGIVSLIFSALAWAFGTVFMKWKDFSRMTPVMLVAVQLVFSAIVLIPFALVVEGTSETDWSLGLLFPLLYAAIPANAVTFALMATVVRRASPTQAASTAYLIPLFGVVAAFLIRGESLGLVELAGGVLVVAGVFTLVQATTPKVPAAAR